MKKILLSAGVLLFASIASAQCNPQAALNEDFSDFTIATSGAFPQNCWNTIAPGMLIYTSQSGDPADQYVTFYTSTAANIAGYVITPEISTIDGTHQLSFSSWRQTRGGAEPTGNVTIQIGTITSVADETTFTPVGSTITVNTASPETHSNIVIPATTVAGTHIAFKILSDTAHNAIGIDNIVWNEIPAPACSAVTTIDEDFTDFTISNSAAFPQNCWTTIAAGLPSGVAIYTAQSGPTNQYVTFYTSTAVNTEGYLNTPEISTIDGEHQLSFSTWRILQGPGEPAGNVSIEVGTITNTADATTFTAFGDMITVNSTTPETHSNIVLPASTATGAHIAFRIKSDTSHNAIGIDNIVWDEVPSENCAAVATINEEFTNFATGALPQNCWTSSNGYPMVTVDAEDEAGTEKSLTIYSFFSANTPIYVVSPEVSTIDGNHKLSFTANLQTGSVPGGTATLKIGTLSDPADYATFTEFGSSYMLTNSDTPTVYENIVLPASATNKHIAFQIVTSANHVASTIDNIVWQSVTAGVDGINANSLSIYPNPTANKNITLTYNNLSNGFVSIYSLTGAKVYETTVNGTGKNINLSSLSSGMYIVKLDSGSQSVTKKLIIQ